MENLRSYGFFFAKNSQEEMLGADMTMIQAFGLFRRVSQNAFAFVRKRQIDRSGNLFADCGSAFDFLSDAFDRGRIPQKSVRQILVLADQTQQQVLGLDRRTSELTGLIPGKEDDS